jgi:hypothetical protein
MTSFDPPQLGILMLDTRFPRILGDVGNPATWPFPVRYRTVPGATPESVVTPDPTPFLKAFIKEGVVLVEEGCTGIATTCGFLGPMRTELSRALGVPVATTALDQGPQIIATLPRDRRVGILTISAESLVTAHLVAAGLPPDTAIEGMEGTAFAHSILGNRPELDVPGARREMAVAARRLVSTHPEVGALILECTNMAPYASDVAAEVGMPVFSIYSYLTWFQAGLSPHAFR